MLARVIRTTSIATTSTATTLIAGTITRTAARTLTRPVALAPLARTAANPSRSSAAISVASMSSSSTSNSQPTTATTTTPMRDESRNPDEASPPQVQSQDHQQPGVAALRPDRALPAPGDVGGDGVTKLDVSGEGSTVKLDALGPLVVNENGTVSRIGNWAQMTDFERQNTLRILGKRNKIRLDALKAKGEGLDMSGERNQPKQ